MFGSDFLKRFLKVFVSLFIIALIICSSCFCASAEDTLPESLQGTYKYFFGYARDYSTNLDLTNVQFTVYVFSESPILSVGGNIDGKPTVILQSKTSYFSFSFCVNVKTGSLLSSVVTPVFYSISTTSNLNTYVPGRQLGWSGIFIPNKDNAYLLTNLSSATFSSLSTISPYICGDFSYLNTYISAFITNYDGYVAPLNPDSVAVSDFNVDNRPSDSDYRYCVTVTDKSTNLAVIKHYFSSDVYVAAYQTDGSNIIHYFFYQNSMPSLNESGIISDYKNIVRPPGVQSKCKSYIQRSDIDKFAVFGENTFKYFNYDTDSKYKVTINWTPSNYSYKITSNTDEIYKKDDVIKDSDVIVDEDGHTHGGVVDENDDNSYYSSSDNNNSSSNDNKVDSLGDFFDFSTGSFSGAFKNIQDILSSFLSTTNTCFQFLKVSFSLLPAWVWVIISFAIIISILGRQPKLLIIVVAVAGILQVVNALTGLFNGGITFGGV